MSDPSRFLPIEYDPTIGEACLKFGHIYRQTRGMYLSITRRRKVKDILKNWPQTDVRSICITDGGRILGLGDLGANGMGIDRQLQLYSAAAGVPPQYLLPMYRDADTNNEQYLQEGSMLDAELEFGSKNDRDGSRSELALAERDLRNTVVRVPHDGRVTGLNVRSGLIGISASAARRNEVHA